MSAGPWTIDVFRSEQGEALVEAFIGSLVGRDREEAFALVKLLQQQGNELRRPQSASLGEGLFELRGRQIRIFYMFLPGRRIVLLHGEIKKRDEIPPKTLKRVRGYRDAVLRRGPAAPKGKKL